MNKFWQKRGLIAWLLSPVSVLFGCVVQMRSTLYKNGFLKVHKFAVPVVVVGNISVGGTGKTPIVSLLVKRCQSSGKKPGIVSRGYGAFPAKSPRMVDSKTPVELGGDEPVLLARETGAPICICSDRSAAVKWLLAEKDVDIIISDDGMQHYAMYRNIEFAIVDGQRLLGNGWLLPAGPLREPAKRLSSVEVVAVQQANNNTSISTTPNSPSVSSSSMKWPVTGYFHLEIKTLQNLSDQHEITLDSLNAKQVHAVAGVGNPGRYFASLHAAGLEVIEHAMPDHHRYTVDDIAFDDQLPILITSKDAVKIQELDADLTRVYEVCVAAKLDSDLDQAIDRVMATIM